jgi:precorrin-6Y C5,15-methyltransferase (decarboxylating)
VAGPNIHIIGLGVSEFAELSTQTQTVLGGCDMVIGSSRQLDTVASLLDGIDIIKVVLPKLDRLKATIINAEAAAIAVIASGDPLYFGIGRWFSNNFASQYLSFYPAVSSIQVACHRFGLSLQDISVLSLHGRPLEKLRSKIKANTTLVVLTDKFSQPQVLARECIAAGFDQSILHVCENLGYTDEKLSSHSAQALALNHQSFDPLHVSIISVMGKGGVLPEFPGFPDAVFETGVEPGKGMISKREVRLTILSFLQPANDDVIWDIGAGCGGVSVELAYWNEQVAVHAVEYHPQRLQYLATNQHRFGVVSNLHIVNGRAPEALAELPAPNKVFVGGSDGELNNLLLQVWQQLPAGGILVASAVIDSTKQQLQSFAQTLNKCQVESVMLGVSRGSLVEKKISYIDKLPVEIFCFKKISSAVGEM